MKQFSGYPGDLSPEQEKCFTILKHYVKEQLTADSYFDDHYLLRFCRARDFDVSKVIKMFDDHWKWRQENDVANIHVNQRKKN